MKRKEYVHHGDILLVPIDEIPKGIKRIKEEKLILAEGEITGHMHEIVNNKKAELYFDVKKNKMYLNVLEPTFLKHQQHYKIQIETGYYYVNRVNEYDYFEKQKRKVQD